MLSTGVVFGKQKNGGAHNPPKRIMHPTIKIKFGSDLLSHKVPLAVPSAQKHLATGFGM